MSLKNIKDFTTKEALIRQQVEEGKSSYQIARQTGLSSRTVRRFKERKAKGMQKHIWHGRHHENANFRLKPRKS